MTEESSKNRVVNSAQSRPTPPIERLPIEIMSSIFNLLPDTNLMAITMTSKWMKMIARKECVRFYRLLNHPDTLDNPWVKEERYRRWLLGQRQVKKDTP